MPKSNEIACPACGSISTAFWQTKVNDSGNFPIRECRACRSAFVWPRPGPEEIDAFYRGAAYKNLSMEEYLGLEQKYYPDAAMDASRIIGHCRKSASGSRLIDIGAGFGEFTKAARKAGFEVTACEPNANSRMIFNQVNGFEPLPDMFDGALASRFAEHFNVALASHILEHIPDPTVFVANLGSILVPGGLVAVAVPHFGSLLSRLQGKKDMFICPPEHLNFFSRKGLTLLFERCGFRTLRLETVSKVNRVTIGRAVRGVPWGDWAWKGVYRGMRIADRLGLGMVLNIYLSKASRESE